MGRSCGRCPAPPASHKETSMTKMLTGWAMAVAVLAGGLIATPARADQAPERIAGWLNVYDGGQLFTPAGIDRAKATMSGTQFDHGLVMTIDTFKTLPEDKKAGYTKENEAKFFENWAKELAR